MKTRVQLNYFMMNQIGAKKIQMEFTQKKESVNSVMTVKIATTVSIGCVTQLE